MYVDNYHILCECLTKAMMRQQTEQNTENDLKTTTKTIFYFNLSIMVVCAVTSHVELVAFLQFNDLLLGESKMT